jgi:hypothetical protein
VRTARLLIAVLPLLTACSRPEPTDARPADGGVASQAVWSRDAMSPAGARVPVPGTPEAVTVSSAEPAALAEIVAAAEAVAPRPPSSAGTKIGTSTGAPEPEPQAPAPAAPAEPPRPRVEIGVPSLPHEMATPAIEKAARAQLYWDLVQRCRDPEGRILPPDAIELSFNLDGDGTLVVTTIVAEATDPRYDEAAACMRRELSLAGATFRAPAGGRGSATRVNATVPSVD